MSSKMYHSGKVAASDRNQRNSQPIKMTTARVRKILKLSEAADLEMVVEASEG